MRENPWERYGPYSKKKEKRRKQSKEGGLFTQGRDWLKWKIAVIGGSSFYLPCLEH